MGPFGGCGLRVVWGIPARVFGGLAGRAGGDGTGAVAAVTPLTTGLGWKEVAPPVIAAGDLTAAHLAAARELGAPLAAGLAIGLY